MNAVFISLLCGLLLSFGCRDADLLAPPLQGQDAASSSRPPGETPTDSQRRPGAGSDSGGAGSSDVLGRDHQSDFRRSDASVDGNSSVSDMPATEPDATRMCTATDACNAVDAIDRETRGCGSCGGGVAERTRLCDLTTCDWGSWGDWGPCVCAEESETEEDACGGCGLGLRTRSRSCDLSTCEWGTFTDWSTCSGGGVCEPGERRPSDDCDPCEDEICSDDCEWDGTCALAPDAECRWEGGTNWRCCGAGSWQFCLPSSCQWSLECAACSGCGC